VVRERNRSGFDGDDLHVGDFSLEIKNCAKMDLAGWLKQAEENCPEFMLPVVLHKKKGTTNILEHYVTMSVDVFLGLVVDAIKRREP